VAPFRRPPVRATSSRICGRLRPESAALRFWWSVSFGLRPGLTPRAFARSRLSLVLVRIRSRSNSASPPWPYVAVGGRRRRRRGGVGGRSTGTDRRPSPISFAISERRCE
jgi:hypothetical protein